MFYGGTTKTSTDKPGSGGGGQRRHDRLEQMSKQQELIEQKKKEIEAKLEMEKQLEVNCGQNPPRQHTGAAGPGSFAISSAASVSTTNNSSWTVKSEPVESSEVGVMKFANDGSFMDQFRKMQEQKVEEEKRKSKQGQIVSECGPGGQKKPSIKVMNLPNTSVSKTSGPINSQPEQRRDRSASEPNLYSAVPPPPPPPPPQQRQRENSLPYTPNMFQRGNYNSEPPPPPPPPPPSYPPPTIRQKPTGWPSQAVREFAAAVAENGNQHEDSAKSTKNPLLWFLNRPDSEEYRLYRELVLELRSSSKYALQSQQHLNTPSNAGNELAYRYSPPFTPHVSGEIHQTLGKRTLEEQDDDARALRMKRRSRWGPQDEVAPPTTFNQVQAPQTIQPPFIQHTTHPNFSIGNPTAPLPRMTDLPVTPSQGISQLGSDVDFPMAKGLLPSTFSPARTNPQLLAYARQSYGTVNLDDEQWKQCEEAYKMNLLFQDIARKKAKDERLAQAGKFKYEYDSDEELDEHGTWEHKQRMKEMEKTKDWALGLTSQAKGKHHIGDFLPPEELAKFMDKYKSVKEGKQMTESAYEDFKIAQDNVGFKLLQKMGWTDGQGLGASSQGITAPIEKNAAGPDKQGLGLEKPSELREDDDEYAAYRKRMMLAYRFRPNPLNNPRRAYY